MTDDISVEQAVRLARTAMLDLTIEEKVALCRRRGAHPSPRSSRRIQSREISAAGG
jgi:hypothetical protein